MFYGIIEGLEKVVIIVSTVRSTIKHNELVESTVLAFSAIIEGTAFYSKNYSIIFFFLSNVNFNPKTVN